MGPIDLSCNRVTPCASGQQLGVYELTVTDRRSREIDNILSAPGEGPAHPHNHEEHIQNPVEPLTSTDLLSQLQQDLTSRSSPVWTTTRQI